MSKQLRVGHAGCPAACRALLAIPTAAAILLILREVIRPRQEAA